MDIVEFSEAFRNFIIAAATIVTSWAAYIGVKTWKDEITGTTRFAIAKNISISLINLRDKYIEVRQLSDLTRSFLNGIMNIDNVEDKGFYIDSFAMKIDEIQSDFINVIAPLESMVININNFIPEAETMFGIELTILNKELNNELSKIKNHYKIFLDGFHFLKPGNDKFLIKFVEAEKFFSNYSISITSDDEFIILINRIIVFLQPYLE